MCIKLPKSCVYFIFLCKFDKEPRCFLEKFTQLGKFLHDRRSRRSRQISSLVYTLLLTSESMNYHPALVCELQTERIIYPSVLVGPVHAIPSSDVEHLRDRPVVELGAINTSESIGGIFSVTVVSSIFQHPKNREM